MINDKLVTKVNSMDTSGFVFMMQIKKSWNLKLLLQTILNIFWRLITSLKNLN